MKKIFTLFCLLLPLSGYSKEWKVWTSEVATVQEDNYYNIAIPQQLSGHAKYAEFPGIRLYNSQGIEIPHFIRSGNIREELNLLKEYTLIENSGKDSLNTLVIHNEAKEKISRFLILSRPAEVSKWVQVRGSNDGKKWFIIKQYQNITQQVYRLREYEVIPVTFPEGTYVYYEVNVRTNEKSPLDIVKVAHEESSVHYSALSPLPVPQVFQKDSSDRYTYLSFPTLTGSYWYDKVSFYVKYPGDYYRKGKNTDNSYSFTLSSYQSNTLFPGMQRLTPETTFRISNEHNPPLTIDSIRFYTVPYYVCAFLSAGEQYTLTLDESLNGRPSYDIEHFRNKIPEDIPVVSVTTPVTTIQQIAEHTRNRLWIEQPAVLWGIIILVGIFLTGICFFVMKDMKKK